MSADIPTTVDAMRTRNYSIDELVAIATSYWEISYRHTDVDVDAERAALRYCNSTRDSKLQALLRDPCMGQFIMGTAKWAHFGCPRVIPHGHKYAAALMCTAMKGDLPVRAPWDTFVVDIPDRLIPLEGVGVAGVGWVVRALVNKYISSRGERWTIIGMGDNGTVLWEVALFRDALLNDGANEDLSAPTSPFSLELTDSDQRSSLLLRRYVVGICLEMASREGGGRDADGRDRSAGPPGESPRHRAFKVGRALDVDCRETVSRFASGARGAPSVNWVVVGHFRNQACGPNFSQRKLIWIEPHWGNNKAGAAAPVALRPHILEAD